MSEMIVALTAALELLGRRYSGGAGLAVAFPGWVLDPVEHTVFVTAGDANRIEKLERLIEADGVPSAFVFLDDQGNVCCNPTPWSEADMDDYHSAVATHFASVLVADGKATWPAAAVN